MLRINRGSEKISRRRSSILRAISPDDIMAPSAILCWKETVLINKVIKSKNNGVGEETTLSIK